MKYRLTVIVKKNPKVTIDFEFKNLYDMKEFLDKWLDHAVLKKLELSIEGFDC